MTRTRFFALAFCIGLTLASFTAAGDKLDHPRDMSSELRSFTMSPTGEIEFTEFLVLETEWPDTRARALSGRSDLAPGADTDDGPFQPLALGPGASDKLAAFATWVTSDFEETTFTTGVVWSSNESFVIWACFFTTKDKNLSLQVKLKGVSSGVVYNETVVGTPVVDVVGCNPFAVGLLSPDDYVVSVKAKQGKNKVGLKFHFLVSP